MNILKSKTIWTFVALFVFNGLPAVKNLVPVSFQPIVDFVLVGLGIWFRSHPVQQFGE